MEKKYYSILRRYEKNPFSGGMDWLWTDAYHGYIFRKDEDGPTLIYDKIYSNINNGKFDLNEVADSFGIKTEYLGVFCSEEYMDKLKKIFVEGDN